MAVPSAKERLGFLDVARGVAALFVLAEHGLGACFPELVPSVLGNGSLGRAGVILFLIISGFIIPASLEQGGSNARFWLRRFFRLFPAYWLSIAVAYGYGLLPGPSDLEVSLGAGDWLLNLTMLQGFFGRPNVWGVFWTLQLELLIYVSCSLLFAARLLRRADQIACLAFLAYAVIGLARPLCFGKPFGINGQRFLYFAPLVGLVAHSFTTGRFGRSALLTGGVCQIFMVGAIWSLNHALFPLEMTSSCLGELACTWGIAYACFFLLLALRSCTMPAAGCWLGRISYSVYLLHPFVLVVLSRAQLPPWAFLSGLLLGTLILAQTSYWLVELPGIALGRALERRWWPPRPQTAMDAILGRRAA